MRPFWRWTPADGWAPASRPPASWGRWRPVVVWGGSWTSPLLWLDRRTGQLHDPLAPRLAGHRALRGGAALNDLDVPRLYWWGPRARTGSGVSATLALNSAYAYGVGGASVGYRHPIRTDRTLAAVYWYVNSLTGSPADLNIEHRTGDTTKPGTTLVGSVATGAPVVGWNRAVFSPALSLTAGDTHWTVVADANGSTTDYATILLGIASVAFWYPESAFWILETNTNGWTGAGSTDAGRRFAFVWEYGDGAVAGWSAIALGPTVPSHSLGGAKITWPTTARLWGAMPASPSVQDSGFRVYAGAPSGGPRATSSQVFREETNANAAFFFATPVEVSRGATEFAVFSFSATTAARGVGLGTHNGHNVVLRKAFDWAAQGAAWVQAPDGTATAWTENPDINPSMHLLLEDFPTPEPGVAPVRVTPAQVWAI